MKRSFRVSGRAVQLPGCFLLPNEEPAFQVPDTIRLQEAIEILDQVTIVEIVERYCEWLGLAFCLPAQRD